MRKARSSTVNIDHDQHALIRGTIRHVTKVTGRAYTLAQFVRDAFNNQLQLIWRDYNDGKPIPPDAAPLPPRTVGSYAVGVDSSVGGGGAGAGTDPFPMSENRPGSRRNR